ncbi:MAG: TlpA family protein disulfide reductase [Chloroflexi bacterium]|nr:TlpA family protein disulfide reductase [Chloroflexota bacterium]
MNRTAHTRTTKRIWMLALIGLVAVAAIACGSDSATGKTSQSSARAAAGGSEESVGNAPPVTGETFSHGAFSLEMHEGKPVLVNFWFPSCPPCRAEMPDLQTAFEKYGDQVAFIGIQQLGLDSPASGAAFVEELGLTYPSLPDTESRIQFDYEVFSYPTTVFLDKNHNIARTWTGIIGAEQLDEQLEALLAG